MAVSLEPVPSSNGTLTAERTARVSATSSESLSTGLTRGAGEHQAVAAVVDQPGRQVGGRIEVESTPLVERGDHGGDDPAEARSVETHGGDATAMSMAARSAFGWWRTAGGVTERSRSVFVAPLQAQRREQVLVQFEPDRVVRVDEGTGEPVALACLDEAAGRGEAFAVALEPGEGRREIGKDGWITSSRRTSRSTTARSYSGSL